MAAMSSTAPSSSQSTWKIQAALEHALVLPPIGAPRRARTGPCSRGASPRASAAAAAACRPSSRSRSRGCGGRSARHWGRGCRARGTPRRQSPGCRAARRTRTSRGRAGRVSSCRASRRPVFEITCAVPVLPQTSLPSIRARPPVPPPLTTPHIPSRIACSFSGVTSTVDCGGGGRHRLPARPVVDRLEDVRRDADAAVAERRRVDRHRDRRHADLALADRDRDRFARVPLRFAGRLLPLRRRHQPGAARSADRCSTSRRGRRASPTC